MVKCELKGWMVVDAPAGRYEVRNDRNEVAGTFREIDDAIRYMYSRVYPPPPAGPTTAELREIGIDPATAD